MKRKIRQIIIHCSDSTWGSAAEIRKWHLQRGWSDNGYHFIISNGRIKPDLFIESMNGSVETGRDIEIAGAHAKGDNFDSIGICLIGKDSFTHNQYAALYELLGNLSEKLNIPFKNIKGHYETKSGISQGKTCPNFNIGNIRKDMGEIYG